ncbi:hypothetical protein JNUCC83_09900 [Vagococcus sp. JNUCC 83]
MKTKNKNDNTKKIQSGIFSKTANITGIYYCEIKSPQQMPLPKDFKSFNFRLKNGSIGRIASIFKEEGNSTIQVSYVFNNPGDRNAQIQTLSDSKLLCNIKEFL